MPAGGDDDDLVGAELPGCDRDSGCVLSRVAGRGVKQDLVAVPRAVHQTGRAGEEDSVAVTHDRFGVAHPRLADRMEAVAGSARVAEDRDEPHLSGPSGDEGNRAAWPRS